MCATWSLAPSGQFSRSTEGEASHAEQPCGEARAVPGPHGASLPCGCARLPPPPSGGGLEPQLTQIRLCCCLATCSLLAPRPVSYLQLLVTLEPSPSQPPSLSLSAGLEGSLGVWRAPEVRASEPDAEVVSQAMVWAEVRMPSSDPWEIAGPCVPGKMSGPARTSLPCTYRGLGSLRPAGQLTQWAVARGHACGPQESPPSSPVKWGGGHQEGDKGPAGCGRMPPPLGRVLALADFTSRAGSCGLCCWTLPQSRGRQPLC